MAFFGKRPVASSLIALLVLSVVACRNDDRDRPVEPEYFQRELMIGDLEYRFPDIGGRVTEPQLQAVADPDQPFPHELAETLNEDTLRSLEETLLSDLEEEIEGIIFDE